MARESDGASRKWGTVRRSVLAKAGIRELDDRAQARSSDWRAPGVSSGCSLERVFWAQARDAREGTEYFGRELGILGSNRVDSGRVTGRLVGRDKTRKVGRRNELRRVTGVIHFGINLPAWRNLASENIPQGRWIVVGGRNCLRIDDRLAGDCGTKLILGLAPRAGNRKRSGIRSHHGWRDRAQARFRQPKGDDSDRHGTPGNRA